MAARTCYPRLSEFFRITSLFTLGFGIFYLNHSLVDAGFSEIKLAIDKKQKTSLFWLILLYIPIKFFSWLTIKKEIKKFKTIDDRNIKYVLQMNNLDVLTGRTIIVGCKKL